MMLDLFAAALASQDSALTDILLIFVQEQVWKDKIEVGMISGATRTEPWIPARWGQSRHQGTSCVLR